MEETKQKSKIILALGALLLFALLYYFINSVYIGKSEDYVATNEDTNNEVIIQNTAMVGGALPAPSGLPSNLPIENGAIQESVTVTYPTKNAKQLSVSYRTTRSVEEKYAEYKKYFSQEGYSITEGPATSSMRTIFGSKGDLRLSVAISRPDSETLVQLAYLMTSLQ